MTLVLVTGAAAGLGLATAGALADSGHDVVVHSRNAARGPDKALRDRAVGLVHGDLSDRDETLRLAEEADAFGPFDAVIHNAGVMGTPADFRVNLVAPYLLTAVMRPPARWIVLSSSMHRGGSAHLEGLDLDDASRRGGSYSDSKLYVTALAMSLATRRPGTLSHAVDPGWVPTRMGGPGANDSLDEGHRTQEWLATADESEIAPRTGGYWYHRTPYPPHPATLDPGFQDQLVGILEEHTGVPLRA